MAELRIGISGWRYTPWRGVFYPAGLVQREELTYAATAMRSIEINGTFYALQRPESFAQWRDETAEDFVFSVKGHRAITHLRRLKNVRSTVANFLASGLFELGPKLGPILWQLPPTLKFDPERLEAFLKILPRDTDAAAALARRHEPFMKGRESLAIRQPQAIRHALEIRHPSFLDESFIQMLRHHQVALVVADTAGKWPYREDVCSDFMYLRLHGDAELYASGYSDEALTRWARRITSWSKGSQPRDAHKVSPHAPPKRRQRDIYCYLDNDVKVHAPFDALTLMGKLGLPAERPDDSRFTVKPSRRG